jgi:hypothetical protein
MPLPANRCPVRNKTASAISASVRAIDSSHFVAHDATA